jgi:hypothetical protein
LPQQTQQRQHQMKDGPASPGALKPGLPDPLFEPAPASSPSLPSSDSTLNEEQRSHCRRTFTKDEDAAGSDSSSEPTSGDCSSVPEMSLSMLDDDARSPTDLLDSVVSPSAKHDLTASSLSSLSSTLLSSCSLCDAVTAVTPDGPALANHSTLDLANACGQTAKRVEDESLICFGKIQDMESMVNDVVMVMVVLLCVCVGKMSAKRCRVCVVRVLLGHRPARVLLPVLNAQLKPCGKTTQTNKQNKNTIGPERVVEGCIRGRHVPSNRWRRDRRP